ncbi:unnamed protein product [Rhodiola kirilowii]
MSFSIVIAILLASTASNAQSNTPPACVANLIPCANFIGTTSKPPQSCCAPLKTAITTQLDCICGLYNTPGLLQSFKINITQALDLPKRCGIDGASLSACTKVSVPAPAPTGTMDPTSTGTPGTPGTPGKDENGAGRMTGFGIPGLLFMMSWVVLLLW